MSGLDQPSSNTHSVGQWKDTWTHGDIAFHQAEVTPALVKHWSHTVSQLSTDKRVNLTVLVPLCGASLDLVWLLHRPEVSRVCGIEISELALQRLLVENPGLGDDPSRRRVVGPGVECWESADGRLKFYLGDLYSEDLLGELRSSCHMVWDRGSLVAIDVSDREKYAARVRDMCAAEHAWLMELVEYDRSKFGGPPHAISEECVRRLFGVNYRVQVLESHSQPEVAKMFSIPLFTSVLYCLTGA